MYCKYAKECSLNPFCDSDIKTCLKYKSLQSFKRDKNEARKENHLQK